MITRTKAKQMAIQTAIERGSDTPRKKRGRSEVEEAPKTDDTKRGEGGLPMSEERTAKRARLDKTDTDKSKSKKKKGFNKTDGTTQLPKASGLGKGRLRKSSSISSERKRPFSEERKKANRITHFLSQRQRKKTFEQEQEYAYLILNSKDSENPLSRLRSKIGTYIDLPDLGVAFGAIQHPFSFFLSQQRFDILNEFFGPLHITSLSGPHGVRKSATGSAGPHRYFTSLSGPHGIGKSVIGYAAACIAFINRRPVILINADQLLGDSLSTHLLVVKTFSALNQLCTNKKAQEICQSFLSNPNDDTRISNLCGCIGRLFLDSSCLGVRVVDEIQKAYTPFGKLSETFDRSVVPLVHNKSADFTRLLAIGSANSAFENGLPGDHQYCVAVRPPAEEEFKDMIRPAIENAKPKFSSNKADVDSLAIELVSLLGTPRSILRFIETLPSGLDRPEIDQLLKKFSIVQKDNALESLKIFFGSLKDQTSCRQFQMGLLYLTLTLTSSTEHMPPNFRDKGLVYMNQNGDLVVVSRVAKQAFTEFMASHAFVYDLNLEKTRSARGAMLERHLRDIIGWSGFCSDFLTHELCKRVQPLHMIQDSEEVKLPLIKDAPFLIYPQKETFSGMDFFLFDTNTKTVYAIQTSISSFSKHQSGKKNTKMLDVCTGRISTKYKAADDTKKLICKALRLPQQSTTFKYTETQPSVTIHSSPKGEASEWCIVPVFMTESVNMDSVPAPIRLVSGRDLHEMYGWHVEPDTTE